jgi:hypothetical protein
MQAGPAPIPVYRPSYLTDGLEFQGSLIESPANIFYQRVKASRANLVGGSGRMQFQWRSVSDALLMSPTVLLRFRLKIRSPVVWNQVIQYMAVRGIRGPKGALNAAAAYGQTANTACGAISSPAICFADGDAFTSCCSSINLTFNGTSLSLNRTDRFWRDWVKTQISSEDAARIYKTSGGAYDAGDAVGVCVPTYGVDGVASLYDPDDQNDRIAEACQAGLTVDSGIAERCKNLYSLCEPVAAGDDPNARILQVSYPVPVAPLNPWRGFAVPATSPYKNTPLAIPHFSAGGLDFLIENFDKAFLRRMGMPIPGKHDEGNFGSCKSQDPLGIELVGDPEIELKYFRLAHTRSLKESYRFNVWQAQTFLGPLVGAGATQDGHVAGHIVAIGKDGGVGGGVGISQVQNTAEADRTWTCKFDTINLAQVPSFLLISAPRLNSEYRTAAARVDANRFREVATGEDNAVRNKSANLFIKTIRIQVNNAQGHIDKAGGANEAFITSERLFEMTRENAGSHYFKKGGFRQWRDSGMAVLLSSAQFAPGLMVSDGVSYPINIDIEMELQNRHVDVSALALQGVSCHQVVQDSIRAQAQATAIFTKIVLATTETSATTNAMNYPLDSAERLLNQAGMQR